MKKYELLTDDTITLDDGTVLYRIRALIDFGNAKAGELGGYIEKEANLDMSGNAWVSDNARVYGNARVCGKACVGDNAVVNGGAYVGGNAVVRGKACVGDNAVVNGKAWVGGNAVVNDRAHVGGNAVVSGRARLCGNARVERDALVNDDALVTDAALVTDHAWVAGDAVLGGRALVGGDSQVFGGTWEVPPLQIQGTKWSLNMVDKTTLRIGCLEHEIPVWLEQYQEIGKKKGATEAELREYLLYIELAAKLYGFQGGDAGEVINCLDGVGTNTY